MKNQFTYFPFIFLILWAFWFGACQTAVPIIPNPQEESGLNPVDPNEAPDAENPEDDGGIPTPVSPEPGSTAYSESFSGPDGAPWPDPWEVAENSPVTTAQLQGGRAQLQGPTGAVARMVQRELDYLNCDAQFTVEFENFSAQGCGFYCRQNGGYLNLSDPPGQGYALFLEGNSNSLTLWYERDGDEIQHEIVSLTTLLDDPLSNNVPYRLRLQVTQISPNQVQQRAKIWPAGEAEPLEWQVIADEVPIFGEPADNPLTIPELQNVTGGLALDIYNYSGTGSIFLSDLVVEP